ncbi:hypothetical protein [Streptomyces sp. CB03238]|uniref:hypothetical protein n=1 Tax=Streptomyces sp. CB03238 TaxID=1907777 RepID=UPI0015C4D5BD|nr:hypothetical protein [Streptomyces sp. CB03238]
MGDEYDCLMMELIVSAIVLGEPAADPRAARVTWRSLANIAVTWTEHPQLPADLREVLAAARPVAADA